MLSRSSAYHTANFFWLLNFGDGRLCVIQGGECKRGTTRRPTPRKVRPHRRMRGKGRGRARVPPCLPRVTRSYPFHNFPNRSTRDLPHQETRHIQRSTFILQHVPWVLTSCPQSGGHLPETSLTSEFDPRKHTSVPTISYRLYRTPIHANCIGALLCSLSTPACSTSTPICSS